MRKSLSTHGRSLHRFTRNFLLPILLFLWSGSVWGQNPVYINTGDYGSLGWNSISSANNLTSSTSWPGNRIVLTPSGSGNKYFRFTSATSGWSNYGPTSNCASDVQITSTGVATSDCDTKAFFLSISNPTPSTSNVVFKTATGAPGTAKVWANEVQGVIRSVSTVTQSPIAASVVAGQNVTVTATLDGALPTGQNIYIRYSTDNFTNSTFATGTVAGTTATFTIPAATNTAAAVVKYYILTSGSATPTHADADLMTINYNNNSGSNYSYTVNMPGTIYLHNFGTSTITTNPYTVSPTATPVAGILDSNLNTSSWQNSLTNFTSFTGSTGQALSTQPGSGISSTITLTFNVASGYSLSVSSFNYWRQRSSTSGSNISSITINGTTISTGIDTVPTSGSLKGSTSVANPINGLTGTITVVLNLTAPSATGTNLRLDDFTLVGNVTATAPTVAPTISSFSVASPGSGTSGYVGNTVTLTGTGFTGVSAVKVGGSAGTVISGFTIVNDTTITFPATDASGQIYVENSGGNSTSSASYATLGFITNATGAWGTAATWLGGAVPPSATTTNVTIAHNISGTTGIINVGKLTVNTGITLINSASATINVNTASANSGTITNTGTLTTAAAITNSGTFTNNGTFQINANGSIATNAPVYGSSSTLIYNGVSGYGVNTEWTAATGTIGTTAGFPQNVTLTSSSVNMPASTARGLAGTITIGTGSTLNLGSSIGGDLNVGGNFSNTGTFNANNRSVTFNGSVNQTIVATAVASTFAYINFNSSSASAVLNINENIAVANELKLSQGKVTVANGKTVTISNNGTILSTSGNFSTATTGTINFLGAGTTTGTIDFYPAVMQTPSGLLSVSYSIGSTIQNSLTLNSNSFLSTAPKYASGSTLIYNSGGNYSRGVEWGAVGATFPANGYPHNVTVQNGTTLKIATGLSGTLLANGNLTLGIAASAGSLDMENTANSLQVNGNVNIGNTTGTSTLSLSSVAGGDLFVGGNWTRNTTNGTFVSNNRTVTFNGSLASDQTINGTTTFDFLTINRTGATGNIVLAASIVLNRDLILTNKSIVLSSYNITLPNESSSITSNSSSYLHASGVGQLVRQNLTTGKEYIFPLGTSAASRYAPVKINNLSAGANIGMNVATISNNSSITPNIADWTKVVLTQWKITTSSNITANIYTEWQSINQGSTMANSGSTTGDMGVSQNAAPYQIYDVSLLQYNTQATGVTLSATGINAIVVGNDDAVILSNDDCTGAKTVTVNGLSILGTNTGATTSTAAICGGSVANDVWYKFTTSDAGSYKVSVIGASGVDPILNLYSGTCGALTSLVCVNATGVTATEFITQSLSSNTTYYYRVYSPSALYQGAFTTSVATVATITVNPASLAFGDVSITTDSTVKTFTAKASLLTSATGNIDFTAPTGYQMSLDGTTGWSSSLSLTFTGSTLAETTVYVKLNPSNCGDFNGNISVAGGGATTANVAVTGKGIISATVATAGTDITATTFIAHWGAIAGITDYKLDVYTKGAGTTTNSATTNWGFATVSPDSQPSNVTASDVTRGNNNGTTTLLTINSVSSTSDYATASAGNNVQAAAITGSLSTAASGSAYFEFTLTPVSGANVVVNSISFGSRSSTTGPQAYTVRSSLDNYASNVATGTLSNGGFWQYRSNTGLTTAGAASQAITFRIYGHSGTGSASAGTANWRIDDLNIGLSVTTPIIVNTYINQNLNVGNITSYNVTGLQPNTQYYYVVRATTAACESANSNEVAVTTNNTVVWNGTAWSNNNAGPTAALDSKLTGAYNIATNFETKDLEITSTGSLDVQATKDVIVNGNIILPSDNKITIESDAGLVQKNTGADNNSNFAATVKRTAKLPTKGYTFWSSPVSNQNLYSFSEGYNQAAGSGTGTPWNRFFVYKESSDTFVTAVSGEITLGASSVFDSARGYAIKGKNSYTPTGGTGSEVPASADTFVFNGKINNGPISSQILKNSCGSSVLEADCTKGYNLVGNPYPSNLNFDALYAANSSKIYGTAYFWTNNDITATQQQSGSNYSGNNYAIYNMTGGTPAVEVNPDPHQPSGAASPTPNGIVKVGQGFIIKSKKLGAGSALSFDNTMRVGYDANAHFYNAKKAEKNRFWIRMTSPASIANTVLVGYIPGATNGFEIDFDAELFVIGSDSFYSILGTKKLAIQGKADFSNEDKVPVGTKYAANGTYKISLGNKEGIFENQKIYLKDKLTNSYTDLTSQDYTFSAVKGSDDSRFEIVYKDNAVLATDSNAKSDFTVYRDGEYYVVKSSKSLGKIEIYDTSGRMLITSSTKENTVRIDASSLTNGVYIIKAENSGDLKTKKVIK